MTAFVERRVGVVFLKPGRGVPKRNANALVDAEEENVLFESYNKLGFILLEGNTVLF